MLKGTGRIGCPKGEEKVPSPGSGFGARVAIFEKLYKL
jgi:hypothetical protein